MDSFGAVWELEVGGQEVVAVVFENGGWTAECRSSALEITYVVRFSQTWQPRQVLLFRDLEEPDLWLATDGGGRWGEMNGAHRVDLDGCSDVSVTGSVFSLAMPALRLPLNTGDRAEVHTAEIDSGFLMVLPQHERFHRLNERTWQRESVTAEATTVWNVDDNGLPLDGPGFRRIASS